MIKKILLAAVVAFPLCASAQKFGTVDSQAILPLMPEYSEAEAKISEASKKYEAEYAKIMEELNKKVAEFQSVNEDNQTPQAIKDRRIQEMQELDQKREQFMQTAQQDLQRQQQQLLQPIQEKLITAIRAVGQENGFTLIFPIDVTIYQGTDVVDATPLVKAKLGL